MPYYTRDDDEVDEFNDYDPTPYSGGYDITVTYGRSIPPSDETCYPLSSRSGDAFEYQRPVFSSSHEPAAYGDQALKTEYSSYARPKTRPGGHGGAHVEGEYGGSGSDYGRKPGSGYGGRTEVEYGHTKYKLFDLSFLQNLAHHLRYLSSSLLLSRLFFLIQSFFLFTDDEDIEPDINIPTLRQAPRTRSGTRGVVASFNEAIEVLLIKSNINSKLEDITTRMDQLTISGNKDNKGEAYDMQVGPRDDDIIWSILPCKRLVSLFTISPLK